ncbi:EAL domain-containing protein [Lichenihabitans sp. Uapishka_5]|uniref:putative bifunctional diguanylate cyclase/phosphodiesterase n=1 Tax=Lichenihabitans sp. Uapishka_5 TaxID=3037302 RepID=UPI0029E7F563|nr:EAL domain-containing protein [Lichenihabitans sp. Uapishka_5]MDX7953861.1 EAL domain-containing protein [Lichenihabitans sp. Uapishka_5]
MPTFLPLPNEAPSLSTESETAKAFVRGRQLLAVDRLIAPMMGANIAVAAGLTVMLHHQYGSLLIPWCVVVVVTSVLRFLEAVRSMRSPHRGGRPWHMHRLTVQAVIMALVFNGVPAWLLTQTTGLACTIVVCQLTGLLWAGSLILTTAVPAAVCYVTLTTAVIAGCFLKAGASQEHLYLIVLFVAGGGTALRSVVQQNRVFVSDQLRELALAQKGEVIGVLLRDYEEQTSDWLWETDAELRYRNASERFAQVSGRSSADLCGLSINELLIASAVPGNREALATLRDHMADRRAFRDVAVPFAVGDDIRWWSLSGRPLLDTGGNVLGYRGVGSDVTITKRAEAKIAHLAHHDGLTNLPNRTFFMANLSHAMSVGDLGKLAVLSLDLDGFKAVNDAHGHPTGDALLVAVGERLRQTISAVDLVARFGGDEFVVLVTDLAEANGVEVLCQRIIDRLTASFDVAGVDVIVGVSVGVAFAASDGDNPTELLKNADSALYRAKQAGRGTYRFFSPEADRRLQERQQLLQDLRAALGRDELALFFQPYVDATDGRITGCEALIRWRHPERGLVSPVDFIPLAEESGLINAIGTWVIEQACLEAARWPDMRRVSVNISPIQFRNRGLPEIILAALTRSGLSPSRLEVEVTETVLIEDADAALSLLRQIRALGVRIALDDFGTGYSSLSYLRRFPFDKVKIDRSFVQELETRRDNQVIVSAIRDIAKGLGMTITAEGVETDGQAVRLKQTGCEELQGFLFSRPGLPEDLGLRTMSKPVHATNTRPDAMVVAA